MLISLAAVSLLCGFQDVRFRVETSRNGGRYQLRVAGSSTALPEGGVLDVSCKRVVVECDVPSGTLRWAVVEPSVNTFAEADAAGRFAAEVPVGTPGFYEVTVRFDKELQTLEELRSRFDRSCTPFMQSSRALVGTVQDFVARVGADVSVLSKQIEEVERTSKELESIPAADRDPEAFAAVLDRMLAEANRRRARCVLVGTSAVLERMLGQLRVLAERSGEKKPEAAPKEPNYAPVQDGSSGHNAGGATSEHTAKTGKVVPVPDVKAPEEGSDQDPERPKRPAGPAKPRVEVLAKFLHREAALLVAEVCRGIIEGAGDLLRVGAEEREKLRAELGTRFEAVQQFCEQTASGEGFSKWTEVEDREGKMRFLEGVEQIRVVLEEAEKFCREGGDGKALEEAVRRGTAFLDRLQRALTR